MKSERAAPAMNATGMNTMQMQSVDTNAGIAICGGAVEDGAHERLSLRHVAVDVLDLDRRVVDEDADGQREPAERHQVDASRRAHERTISETRIDSGIETTTMSVLRQLPRKRRIMSAVSPAAMAAFLDHALDRRAHEDGLIEEQVILYRGGSVGKERRHDRADALHDVERRRARALQERHQTPRRPSAWTMLVCGAKPSRTLATSPMVTVAPFTALDGRVAISLTASGLLFKPDEQLLLADLRRARRQDEVLAWSGVVDVVRREAERVEARKIDVDHDLALLAAVGVRASARPAPWRGPSAGSCS